MKWNTLLQIIGVVALVAFAILEARFDVGTEALVLLVVGLVALVSPEALDRLPIGPNKE